MPNAATGTRAAPRPRRLRRLIGRLLALLLLLPLVAILVFRFLPPPMTPLMLIRVIEGHGWQRDWVPHQAIAPALAAAVVASEDNLFCEQVLGFDFDALSDQVDAWSDGGRPRGASTITMQTAKNLFLWPGRDPVRKVLEAWLTPQIALLWPRRRVLETYLNIVEFGPGIYGAEAAARHFFRKPAAALSSREAALLAAVLPNPLAWSAAEPSAYIRRRAATIERRMAQIRPLLACTW
ncbi:monofunctional biosynthetic peptidoglycan transglycosylase [Roseomonas hellenica]|uniref:Biosynthetic peptidoglycan transglycosylase n=1 Tax=Plastoroseomonas hellenica TaxID=2687306 RepID=A0ABS5F7J1_9PROT|nr:monofunctional biosynthetic peptidoglycan transglycosylase [Plastoroseomonas hellenica]MBR0668538.1 monofunctional biosynthetic peptidoglycan transglycosylase [Plastoroseomonas hellenica]